MDQLQFWVITSGVWHYEINFPYPEYTSIHAKGPLHFPINIADTHSCLNNGTDISIVYHSEIYYFLI